MLCVASKLELVIKSEGVAPCTCSCTYTLGCPVMPVYTYESCSYSVHVYIYCSFFSLSDLFFFLLLSSFRDHKTVQLSESRDELERAMATIHRLQQEVRKRRMGERGRGEGEGEGGGGGRGVGNGGEKGVYGL